MVTDTPTLSGSASGAIEKILVAAEIEFAERGFDGAGMKAISKRADVSQALLHYHFGSKDQLYTRVVEHRSRMINAERIALLEQVNLDGANALAGILEALFRPPLGPAGGDHAYKRIFGGLIVGQERDQALVRACYDPTARRFIDALTQAVPDLGRATAAQAYTLALGTLVVVISRDGRLERLMGAPDKLGIEETLASLIRFGCAGIRALAAPD